MDGSYYRVLLATWRCRGEGLLLNTFFFFKRKILFTRIMHGDWFDHMHKDKRENLSLNSHF